MYIYNDDELAKKIDLLNSLLNPYLQWQYTTARKDHEDLFEIIIKEREVYFKRRCGQARDDVIKISRKSMDQFIYVLFNGDFRIQGLAEAFQKKRAKEEQLQINKLNFE